MNLFDALIMLVEILTGRTIIKLARKDKSAEGGVVPTNQYESLMVRDCSDLWPPPDIQVAINRIKNHDDRKEIT